MLKLYSPSLLTTSYLIPICRESHLEDINKDSITLWKQREAYTFERIYDEQAADPSYRFGDESLTILDDGMCVHACTLKLYSVLQNEYFYNIGIYYFDSGGAFIYRFNPSSGKLLRVEAYVHNVTLDLQYSDRNMLQYIVHSRTGKRLAVNYTDNDLVRSIQLLDNASNVEKTTYVVFQFLYNISPLIFWLPRSFYNYDSSETHLLSVNTGDMTLYYEYNEEGDIINATGRFGGRKTFTYDQYGWVQRIEDYDSASQFISSTEYNISSSGKMKIFTSPTNTSHTLVHDHLGNVVSVATNDGLPEMAVELPYGRKRIVGDEVSRLYNLASSTVSQHWWRQARYGHCTILLQHNLSLSQNLLSTHVPPKIILIYIFQLLAENREQGNTLFSIDPNGVSYKYERDENGNLINFEDGDGNSYTFSYNENGLQNSSSFPDGSHIKFEYNDKGLLTTLTNQDNSTINLLYDDDDTLVRFLYVCAVE